MSRQSIKEIVDKAKEAVSHLEEPYRTKAFEVVLTRFLQEQDGDTKNASESKTTHAVSSSEPVTIDAAMNSIDRTKYPVIFKLDRVLDRALCALFIAQQHGIDGLTAQEISRLLTEKFRITGTPEAVSMSLMKSNYVDRTSIAIAEGGSGYKYKLMHSGEEYVNALLKGSLPANQGIVKKNKSAPFNRVSSGSRKEGLKNRVVTLIEKSFFQQLREVPEVRQRLRDDGFPYDLEPIRTTMVRLVREGKLRRVQEVKGDTQVYKYINP